MSIFAFAYDDLCIGVVGGAPYLLGIAPVHEYDKRDEQASVDELRFHNLD
jgi:hypothetical protein